MEKSEILTELTRVTLEMQAAFDEYSELRLVWAGLMNALQANEWKFACELEQQSS